MINIDLKSNKPIYEQIIEQIKENVIKGYLKPNDILPSVRKLAIMINVNPNTVSKAYQELERQNVIVTIRGKGTFVEDIGNNKINDSKMELIVKKLQSVIIDMKYLGLSDEEIINLVKKISSEMN